MREGITAADWKRRIDAEAKRLMAAAHATENVEQLEAIERDLERLVYRAREFSQGSRGRSPSQGENGEQGSRGRSPSQDSEDCQMGSRGRSPSQDSEDGQTGSRGRSPSQDGGFR